MSNEGLIVNSGVLTVLSTLPRWSILEEGKEESMWVPKITLVSPEKDVSLKIIKGNIWRSVLPTEKEEPPPCWYEIEKENPDGVNISDYYLLPGSKSPETIVPFYEMQYAFVPDRKDKSQERKSIYVIKGDARLSSRIDFRDSIHSTNERSMLASLYHLLFAPKTIFQYDLGWLGLAGTDPKKKGRLEISIDQARAVVELINQDSAFFK